MPKRKPKKFEVKKMLAVGICIAVKVVMKNHIYRFGGELRRQQEGGPIGVELTGALADLFMLYWDRAFLQKLSEMNIKVKGYKRFKDDTNIIINPIDRNMKYENGHLIQKTKDEIEKEYDLKDDEVSMKIVKDVADSIEEMVQTEMDFPSNSKNSKKKLSILDIQVWVEKIKITEEIMKNQIVFEFYEKPMSSKFVMMTDSDAPMSQKRTVQNPRRFKKA